MNPKVGYRNLWAEGEILAYSSEYGQAPVEGTQEPSVEFSWQSRHGVGSGNGQFVIAAPTEMVSNGGFAVNTTGWSSGEGSLASVAGGINGNCLQITRVSGVSQSANQDVTGFVIGQSYNFVVYVKSGTSGNEAAGIAIWRTSDWTSPASNFTITSSGAWTAYSLTFTATATTHRVELRKNTATAGTMQFDEASIFLASSVANNAVDFVIGSDMYFAYLTAGTYNGQTLAAEVVTQMDAASGATFTCVYDDAAAKFTVARAAGNFSLLWNTGAHSAFDASGPMGFSAAADKTGAATYTSDAMVCHTSETIDCDLGLNASYDFVGIRGHNLSNSAVITLTEASDAAFTTDVVTDTVTYSGDTIWQKLPATRTGRYVRLTVSDPANTSAYVEVGPMFLGLLQEINREISPYQKGSEDVSVVEITQKGVALVTDRRDHLKPWPIMISGFSDAGMTIIQDLRDTMGRRPAWVFCLDDTSPSTNTYWVRIREDELPQYLQPAVNAWTVTLEEVT